jgi:hypothetical protein
MLNTPFDTLQQQLQNITQTIEVLNRSVNEINKELQTQRRLQVNLQQDEFDLFLIQEITPYFGELTATNIVKTLQYCRKCGNDYTCLNPVYQWKDIYGDLQKRQLLKLVSAAYRLKYKYQTCSSGYVLRSEIKYANACSECGKLASLFYDRLVQEGMM